VNKHDSETQRAWKRENHAEVRPLEPRGARFARPPRRVDDAQPREPAPEPDPSVLRNLEFCNFCGP
jgi:hypothetical protein